MTVETASKPITKRPRKMAREPAPRHAVPAAVQSQADPSHAEPKLPKPTTKTDLILGLLRRDEGATLEAMVEATGWLPHTTRAALTGLKKKGHEVTSAKADGVRTYRFIKSQGEQARASGDDEGGSDA